MTYINSIHRVIPVQQIAKTRKSNRDTGSQLADAYAEQELLYKVKRRKPLQENNGIATFTYAMNGMEQFNNTSRYFDHKA